MSESEPRVWSVGEVTVALRRLIEQRVPALWVGGEVGTLTMHRSGHLYFSLKDGDSVLNAVYFDGAETAKRLGLAQGTQIEAFGRLALYPQRGSYQLTVQTLRPCGQGTLQAQFEALKRKLHAEGIFDSARKRKLPLLPRRIGLVTSPDGAALQDFLQVAQRRMPNVPIRLAPAAVQGENAPHELVSAIADLVFHGDCDLIVLTRGGGSLEDLWAFNNERLARTLARCPIPVVSAVGHEVDQSIADLAADVRAATPSAAAELVLPDRQELLTRLERDRGRLIQAMRWGIERRKQRIAGLANHFVLRRPQAMVQLFQQRLDELDQRLLTALQAVSLRRTQALSVLVQRLQTGLPRVPLATERRRVAQCQERLVLALRRTHERQFERACGLEHQLSLLSPLRVLGRGYAILQQQNGAAVRTAAQVADGEGLTARLADGSLRVTVRAREIPQEDQHE